MIASLKERFFVTCKLWIKKLSFESTKGGKMRRNTISMPTVNPTHSDLDRLDDLFDEMATRWAMKAERAKQNRLQRVREIG